MQWYPKTYTVGCNGGGIAFDGTNIWATNTSSLSVSKLNASDGSIMGTYGVGNYPWAIAFDGTYIWVASDAGPEGGGGGTVTKLKASDGSRVGQYFIGGYPRGIAFDGAYIWLSRAGVSGDPPTVIRVKASDGSIMGTYDTVAGGGVGIVFDGANIWVSGDSNTVNKLEANDGSVVGTYTVGNYPRGIAFDGANIWVTNGDGQHRNQAEGKRRDQLGTYSSGDKSLWRGLRRRKHLGDELL